MVNFDLKKTKIFQAVKWERNLVFRFAKSLKKIFLVLSFFLFLIFLYGFLTETLALSLILGSTIILFVLGIIFWEISAFFDSKLKNPKLKVTLEEALAQSEKYNLAEFLSFEVAKAVFKSRGNLTSLFYHLISENPELNFVFSRALLNLKEIKRILRQYLKKISAKVKTESEFQTTILESLRVAQKKGHSKVEVGDLLVALAKHDLIFKKILIDNNLKVEDIEELTQWLESLKEKIEERKRFWEWKNLIKMGSLAKEWTAGYTLTLDRFSIDLTEVVKRQGFPEVIGHQKELEAIERILSRREINNVLLVGEPGVGKKAIVRGLAVKLALGQSLPQINYKRVVALDMERILAQFENQEEVEKILDKIFQEVINAGNVILTINNFHNFLRPEIQPGVIDISGILSSFLPLPQFQIIGITTYEGFHKCIERKPAILEYLEKVEASEISEKETLLFLERLALIEEQKYKRFVSYPALKEIISLSNRYFPALFFPKKAVDLLDEVMVYVASIKEKIVLPKHVAKIVSEKAEIPVGEIEAKEREILLNLEDLLHRRIVNQEEAVKEVSAALRRARAEVRVRRGPMGSFLFLGPTGVGKTETSKALAEIYFGSEKRMIRLDMSEFQNLQDIPRLIGSTEEKGLLTIEVRENPFSLILLDEIEKAHPNILNLFLQVLDEGYITDGLGRKVDFKNSIIIATSNAGYQIILKALKEKMDWQKVKERLLEYVFEKGIFRPEFINRFDGVVIFRPLSKENLLDIAELMLQRLKKKLKEKEIDFVITEPLKEKIVELSYDPTFGAREMQRVIQEKVENVLSFALLSGRLKRGNRVEMTEEFKLKILPQ